MSENITVIKQDNIVNISQVGLQGPRGTIFYRDHGTPSPSLGVPGDYYINADTKEFYGPKTTSGWGTINFLFGGNTLYAGTSAPAQNFGLSGDVFINTSTNTIYTKSGTAWNSGQVLVNPQNFSYVYEQQSMATTWTVHHLLHYRPTVTVMDYGKNNIECDVSHIDADTVELDFSQPVSGYAYLS